MKSTGNKICFTFILANHAVSLGGNDVSMWVPIITEQGTDIMLSIFEA
jgi:hypothetical protein